jgi:hypothetical protein
MRAGTKPNQTCKHENTIISNKSQAILNKHIKHSILTSISTEAPVEIVYVEILCTIVPPYKPVLEISTYKQYHKDLVFSILKFSVENYSCMKYVPVSCT